MAVFTILGIMVTGIIIGFFLRKQKNLIRHTGKINLYVIYLLLFAMGLALGGNKMLMENLHYLGWQGVLIAFSSTLGSVLFAWIVFRVFFKNKRT